MMTVKQIFDLQLKLGISKDPRGPAGVKHYLERQKRELESLPESEKQYFDRDKLTNPYLDSSVLVDDGKTQVKRVLAGIDIGDGEILLASQLNERGKKIDLVIGHHPRGRSLAYLDEAMDVQIDIHEKYGVPIHIAEKIMEERVGEVGRGIHPMNHYQVVDIARILGINFMNSHTTTDNMVDAYMNSYLKKQKFETIGDLMKVLSSVPEYHQAKLMGVGPKIFAGSPKHRVGKYLVEFTGGTNPSHKLYEQLSRSGISTVIGMHMREIAMEKVREHQMNIIIAGHISSDSLGMNLFLDELEKRGIEIVPCGGLIRVSRNKRKR